MREQRLIDANVDTRTREELFKPVKVQAIKIGAAGQKPDSGEAFGLVFGIGFVMYLSILMYGQVILGAVIEEKETRIAEILFSSVKPFHLDDGQTRGRLVGGADAIDDLGTCVQWFALLRRESTRIERRECEHSEYSVFIFHLLWPVLSAWLFYLRDDLRAVGSMVTTAQEGGQLAMPIILMLVVSFYFVFPVIRSPDSSFSFWVSMFPFSAPVAMLVRIVTQTPPFWQIALSLIIGFSSVLVIMWVASRVYRVGMLMYGKRATPAEAWRWARQA